VKEFTLELIDDEIAFVLHYAASEFCARSSFSALDFEVAAYNDALSLNQLGIHLLTYSKLRRNQNTSRLWSSSTGVGGKYGPLPITVPSQVKKTRCSV